MKKLFFAVAEDFGNYEALLISKGRQGLKVDSGYLPGYRSGDKDDASAYAYKKGSLEYSGVIADEPGLLVRILTELKDEPGVSELFHETVKGCVTTLASYKAAQPEENTVDNAYIAATVLKTVSNMPRFIHSRIQAAFDAAVDVSDDLFVQVPGLVYLDSVLRTLPPDGVLEVKELDDGDMMLNAVSVQKKYGKEFKKDISEFAFYGDPEDFDNVMSKAREFMDAGLYPPNDWVLENVPAGPDV